MATNNIKLASFKGRGHHHDRFPLSDGKGPVIIYRLAGAGGWIYWFLGEQKGGTLVTENPKGEIRENFGRIQRGDHSNLLGKWRRTGEEEDRESRQKLLGGSLQRSNIERGHRLNFTFSSPKSSAPPPAINNDRSQRARRQKAYVWQTWQAYYLCVLWWSSLKLMFSDPLQIELFKGDWSSAEKFFNQHNCHACHTRFVLLSKLTGLPILRRPTSFPAPSLLSLPRERSEGAANAWERRPSENQAKFTLTSVEIHFAVEMPQSRYSVWQFFAIIFYDISEEQKNRPVDAGWGPV